MSLGDIDFGSLGGAVSSVFGGVSQLQNATGYQKESQSYQQAAKLATQNAGYAEESTRIQELQAQRQITQTVGAEQAQTAGAGLSNSGSALDLLRSSMQQGALTKQLIGVQGNINATGYQQEAVAYTGMSAAADAAASASKTSGIGGIIGGIAKGIFSIFSDVRLKTDIVYHGTRPDGISLFSFTYKGGTRRWLGVLAQDVYTVRPDAVELDEDTGFYKVRYDLIDAELVEIGRA